MNRRVCLSVWLLGMPLLTGALAGAQDLPTGPANLDFEQGTPGQVPPGWFVPPMVLTDGYGVKLTSDHPKSGKQCALVFRDPKATAAPKTFGNLMQRFAAGRYRGQRVRLRAAVRLEAPPGEGQTMLWLRVDRPKGQMGFFDNMADRPITASDWRSYEIVGDVADDAVAVNFGLILLGKGKAWIDDVSFTVMGKAVGTVEPPRPLTARGRDNLIAYTRLLGYVRHFHPSDAVAGTDWSTFAIRGVRAVENAQDAAELAQKLNGLFQPIAPTVQVFPTGARPSLPAELQPPKNGSGLEVIAWRHEGFGTGDPGSIYSSRRVQKPVSGGKVPAGFPDPRAPYEADLGGGVSCLVPLALYADQKGALPHTTAPPKAPFVPTVQDRATRLADVALAWNVFQHFYPYFDVVQTDWTGVLRDALTTAATDPDENAFLVTLRRMVAALHDGHGHAFGPTAGAYQPPVLWRSIEDQVVVVAVAPEGSASLQPGDVIVKIDGRPTSEALADAEKLVSGATPQWIRWRAVEDLALGPQDSELTLTAQRGKDAPFTVKVRRTLSPEKVFQERYLAEPRPKNYQEIRPGIVYIDISAIKTQELQAALPKLEQAKGIICDLRGYPSAEAMRLLPYLIDKPATSEQWNVPIVTYPDRKQVTFATSRWPPIPPASPHLKAKIAFLTDERAISYAESYMAIVEYYKLGAIVGGPTAGTNGNIDPFTLPGGYTFIWTGMKVLKPDGSQHHGVGIHPTVPVAPTVRGIAAGRDEVLEKAIEVVGQ